jgi:hypothetical protein
MAEWGTDTEHDRFVRLQEQVRRIKDHNGVTKGGLVATEAYYRAQAEDTTLPVKERAQWKALADEVATRLGYNAPPSEQEELPFEP